MNFFYKMIFFVIWNGCLFFQIFTGKFQVLKMDSPIDSEFSDSEDSSYEPITVDFESLINSIPEGKVIIDI